VGRGLLVANENMGDFAMGVEGIIDVQYGTTWVAKYKLNTFIF
jgi:hypothetical protein